MRNIVPSYGKNSLVYLTIVVFFFPTSAYAYVDPGSGSVIVTTVLGFIAAVGYTCRKFFYNLQSKFMGGKRQDDNRSLDD